MKNFSVAIDGPGGSGKSTAARLVAERLGIAYVDTGAMYRAVALHALRNGIDPSDQIQIEKLLDKINIEIKNENGSQKLFLNDEDVTGLLRAQEIAEGSSVAAQYPAVRAKLVSMQREIASNESVVMDGRDVGSVVLPDARVKIFMDASLEERIKRRVSEFEKRGKPCDAREVRAEMQIRDARDGSREHSPMTIADDAVYLDTTGLTAEEVSKRVIEIIKSKTGGEYK